MSSAVTAYSAAWRQMYAAAIFEESFPRVIAARTSGAFTHQSRHSTGATAPSRGEETAMTMRTCVMTADGTVHADVEGISDVDCARAIQLALDASEEHRLGFAAEDLKTVAYDGSVHEVRYHGGTVTLMAKRGAQ